MTIESVLKEDPDELLAKESEKETRNDEKIIEKARLSAHRLIDVAADRASQIESGLLETSDRTSRTIDEKKQSFDYALKKNIVKSRRFAKDNPLLVAGLAFVAGAVVSRAVKR